MQLPPLLLDASAAAGAAGYHVSETHVVALVLALLVVAAALLSYFVVAPEYEKRLEQHYAAALAAHHDYAASARPFASSTSASIPSPAVSGAFGEVHSAQRYLALTHKKISKHRSLGTWDMEAASSDDDAFDHHVQRLLLHSASSESEEDHALTGAAETATPSAASSAPPRSMNAALRQSLTEAQRLLLARRRKSESDALKHANVNRAEMLRRRVLLKKLEEEIRGAIKDTDVAPAGAAGVGSSSGSAPSSSLRGDVRRGSNDALELTEDKLRMLQEHPAECPQELSILAATRTLGLATDDAPGLASAEPLSGSTAAAAADPRNIKQALQTMHDLLSFYLSTDHRDMHKLTVFCNSLLKHDGLNHLRAFEVSLDPDVRTLANAIIEKAVPAIWH
ncbi:hypothetical protein PybrP1_005900 [[Pythium] brassicae (nom. inval.)]|nr:hypothetical protein PybrP1_005900 [[Pythium] brassicae (nom. inval.)]